jgi:hypothetical protein
VTVVEVAPPRVPAEPLFHSPLPMAPYQLDGVAEALHGLEEHGGHLTAGETGVGKTAIATMVAALLFEDGLIDQVLIVAEASKVPDWAEDDVPKFTELAAAAYLGPRRAELLADPPPVLVTSYETAKGDTLTEVTGTRRAEAWGPLEAFLAGRRVLVVYDEAGKMSNRGSGVYRVNDKLLQRLRRLDRPGARHVRVLHLTATSMSTTPVGHFNLCRQLSREVAGTVEAFEREHVAGFDEADGSPTSFKNLSHADPVREVGVVPLADKLRPLVWRKRKTDADVAPYFPTMVEHPPTVVRPYSLHRELLTAVYRHFEQAEEEDGPLYGLMRQLVNYPEAVLAASGALAQEVVRVLGADALRSIRSAKADALLDWAGRLGGRQGICFTFFGETVLPLLARDLREAGHSVSTFAGTGTMTARARQRSKHEFTSGATQVFLASDAGAQGLNLGCASRLLHYEPTTTYRAFTQRSNRLSRFDSPHERVEVEVLMLEASTDVAAYERMLARAEYDEHLLDDDLLAVGADGNGRLTAAARRERLRRALRTS